jgi:flagellar M-ring protein FliF
MSEMLKQFGAVWSRMGINQKVTMIMMIVGLIAGIFVLVTLSGRQSFGVLYAGLDASDAGKVVEYLRDNNIPYRLGNGGTTISVPEESKLDVQASLASKNLTPSSGHVGLEIFAPGAIGASSRYEGLVARRALQGTIARVISRFEQIEWADVQIAQSEESAFLSDNKPTKATVTVKLRSGRILGGSQIAGITQVVVGAVSGLEADKVSIVDNHGNLLSSPNQHAGTARANNRREYQAFKEMDLIAKAMQVLDRKLGPNKAVVQVTADIDMHTETTTKTVYDPDGAIATFTETTASISDGGSGGMGGGKTEKETNTTKTVAPVTTTHTVNAPGEIKSLRIAVLINPARLDAEGKDKPLTQEEKDGLIKVVKAAVGFEEARDTFEYAFLGFDETKSAEATDIAPGNVGSENAMIEMAKLGSPVAAVIVFALFAMFMFRKLGKQSKASYNDDSLYAAMSTASGSGSGSSEDGGENRLSPSVQNNLRHRVKEIISNDPVTAARLLQGWLEEEK